MSVITIPCVVLLLNKPQLGRHFSGVYSIKASMHRFMKSGNATSMPGQEGIPATYSPMTRTLEDLETFWRAIMSMKPWEYDHSVGRDVSYNVVGM